MARGNRTGQTAAGLAALAAGPAVTADVAAAGVAEAQSSAADDEAQNDDAALSSGSERLNGAGDAQDGPTDVDRPVPLFTEDERAAVLARIRSDPTLLQTLIDTLGLVTPAEAVAQHAIVEDMPKPATGDDARLGHHALMALHRDKEEYEPFDVVFVTWGEFGSLKAAQVFDGEWEDGVLPDDH